MARAKDRLDELEQVSNTMLNRLANCGTPIADTPCIEDSKRACRDVVTLVETAIAEGRIGVEDVFDADYVPIPATNPVQYLTRFSLFADAEIRPLLTRFHEAHLPRSVGCVLSDVNGYLPTHLPNRSQPQSDDPAWNDKNCRNRRILMDEMMHRVMENECDPMLITYRTMIDKRVVKSIFIPLYVAGQRWGNFEYIYRDDEGAERLQGNAEENRETIPA